VVWAVFEVEVNAHQVPTLEAACFLRVDLHDPPGLFFFSRLSPFGFMDDIFRYGFCSSFLYPAVHARHSCGVAVGSLSFLSSHHGLSYLTWSRLLSPALARGISIGGSTYLNCFSASSSFLLASNLASFLSRGSGHRFEQPSQFLSTGQSARLTTCFPVQHFSA
jgi:hypothetical protein